MNAYEEYRNSVNNNRSKLLWTLQLPIVCMFNMIGLIVLLILFVDSGGIELENHPLYNNGRHHHQQQ